MIFRKVIIALCAGATLYLAASEEVYPADKENLEFSVFLVEEKDSYGPRDPIYLKFKLKNSGKKPVMVNKRFFLNSKKSPPVTRDVYLEITGPSGKKIEERETNYETGYPRTVDFTNLKSDAEAESKYKRNLRAYFDLKSAGTYTITAFYKNSCGDELDLDVFKKEITSHPIKIVIKE